MQTFEIRILKADGSLSMATTLTHLNSDAVTRAAKLLAGDRPFEVWADDRCVYTSAVALDPSRPPDRPAA